MDPSELHRRTVEEWVSRVSRVGDDDWHRPTPCRDWDVRALVNHLAGEDLWTRPLVEGATMEEVGDRFDGDLLGDDPCEVASAAAAEAVAAVSRRTPEQGVVHLSFGETPIEEYVRQLAADHLVHAWDLAAATGQSRDLDPALVGEVAEWFVEREELYRAVGVIGARESAGQDPQSRLLTAFGRDPSW
jgi:uncharacterized protein (TIGR03086 family)